MDWFNRSFSPRSSPEHICRQCSWLLELWNGRNLSSNIILRSIHPTYSSLSSLVEYWPSAYWVRKCRSYQLRFGLLCNGPSDLFTSKNHCSKSWRILLRPKNHWTIQLCCILWHVCKPWIWSLVGSWKICSRLGGVWIRSLSNCYIKCLMVHGFLYGHMVCTC